MLTLIDALSTERFGTYLIWAGSDEALAIRLYSFNASLWRVLRPIFQAKGLQRSDIAAQLKDFRLLRNRVAHYEPIIALPLAQRYADLTTLTGWLSSDAAAWINHSSTWATIYPAVPILKVDPATGTTRFAVAALPFLPE